MSLGEVDTLNLLNDKLNKLFDFSYHTKKINIIFSRIFK